MAFKIDFLDDTVLEWSLTENGATVSRNNAYTPTIYVSAHGDARLADVRQPLREHPDVERTAIVEERIGFRHDHSEVLRVDVCDIDAAQSLASTVSQWAPPGNLRCYNVDLTREFRYCLEQGRSPLPERPLRVMDLSIDEPQLARGTVTELTIDDDHITGTPTGIVHTLTERLQADDPDVLKVNTSEIIPALYGQAERTGVDAFQMGRKPGYQQLAGTSNYTSYGRVGHSPARYNIPGRVIIDESNTFFWNQSNLNGCLYLVERSWKPLQELAWSSMGSILTAIQIREARERDVLAPWHSWRHEKFKTMGQLDEADRGGFTFAPKVGLHEDVHELDFSSLYPNIIVTRNLSPETVRCDCHADREDVPGLGYAVCDERGYLGDVLEPLIEDRDAIKAAIRETDDPEEVTRLEGRSSAIKWILVCCFGYQGFSNAKFGRIECHEAINAYAREILLDTKETLETNGWEIVHGIVDSVWVTPIDGEPQTPLDEVAAEITESVGITLEHEAHYEWIAFVPMRDSEAGALTKYFGKENGAETYKYRGIECRQRSTPPFIKEAQTGLIEALARTRDPEAVCDRLQRWMQRLRTGDVQFEDLVVTNRVSKPRAAYTQYTRNVAALERAENQGLTRNPGQSVEYVVVDDGKRSADRVVLAHEQGDEYDEAFYREQLLRAAESVLSPLGWRERTIKRYLSEHEDTVLSAYL